MNNLEGQMSMFDASGTVALKSSASMDFGKHIGGARKEQWSARGLFITDILEMNEAEKVKFIKKDQIWKKPDYDQMINNGTEVIVAYAIKQVRDAIPSKPCITWKESDNKEAVEIKQKSFISFVSLIRDTLAGVKSREDFFDAQEEIRSLIIDPERSSRSFYVYPDKKYEGLLTTKLLRALSCTARTFSSESYSGYATEIKRKQFGVAKEQKVPAGWGIHFNDSKGYSRTACKKDTYYITKGHCIVESDIVTYEDALKKCKEYAKKVSGKKKSAFIPEQLEHVQRVGLEDVRNGRNVAGDDFLHDFNIRGGEFGEWMSEKDAQTSLNMAYEAFCDFADVLGIPRTSVSFDGRLSIAFGARGRGNAVAHYEPLREVINVTKMRGAGSLGHEMFHALDDIVGKKLGLSVMMTEAKHGCMPDSVRKVVDVMNYRPATEAEKAESRRRSLEISERRLRQVIDSYFRESGTFSDDDKKKRQSLIDAVVSDNSDPIYLDNARPSTGYTKSIGERTTKAILNLSDFKKTLTGHVIRRDSRDDIFRAWYALKLSRLSAATDKEMTVPSDYLINSKKMDECSAKDSFGYWASTCEMFARAGACYLADKLAEKGGKSDYLCGHSESCVGFKAARNGDGIEIIKAMPQGEERKRINAAISEMIEDLKSQKLL